MQLIIQRNWDRRLKYVLELLVTIHDYIKELLVKFAADESKWLVLFGQDGLSVGKTDDSVAKHLLLRYNGTCTYVMFRAERYMNGKNCLQVRKI